MRLRQMNGNSVREDNKYFELDRLEQPRQNKHHLHRHDKPNEPTRPLSFVIFESPCTSVSTVSRGLLSRLLPHTSFLWNTNLMLVVNQASQARETHWQLHKKYALYISRRNGRTCFAYIIYNLCAIFLIRHTEKLGELCICLFLIHNAFH